MNIPVNPRNNVKRLASTLDEDVQMVRKVGDVGDIVRYAQESAQYLRDKAALLASHAVSTNTSSKYFPLYPVKRTAAIGTYSSSGGRIGSVLSKTPGHFRSGTPAITEHENNMLKTLDMPGFANEAYAVPHDIADAGWLTPSVGASPWDQGGGKFYTGLTNNSRTIAPSGKITVTDDYMVKKKKQVTFSDSNTY